MERKRVMFRYPPSGDGTRYEADALNLGPYCTREVSYDSTANEVKYLLLLHKCRKRKISTQRKEPRVQ